MEWLQILSNTQFEADHGSKNAGPAVDPLTDLKEPAADRPAHGDGSKLVDSAMQSGMYKGLEWQWLVAYGSVELIASGNWPST